MSLSNYPPGMHGSDWCHVEGCVFERGRCKQCGGVDPVYDDMLARLSCDLEDIREGSEGYRVLFRLGMEEKDIDRLCELLDEAVSRLRTVVEGED